MSMRNKSLLVPFLIIALVANVLCGCYRDRTPSRFQLKDTLVVADTMTQKELDSISFAHEHHYSRNFNFIVRADSIALLNQQPEEIVSGMQTDSFMVPKNTRMVVADIRVMPQTENLTDSVWVQVATEGYEFGWIHESELLKGVDPDDPISQFISTFSDSHTLVFLVIISLIAVGYLLRKQLRHNAKIVHFNDIASFYPTLLAVNVAFSATLYASIQMFMPEMWREFYFHPSLNPFSQPFLLGVFLASVWSMLIVGIAVIDDTRRYLGFSDAFLYLSGLAAVCAFNYIIFSVSTLYYVGYLLFIAYVWFAIRLYFKNTPALYTCGKCGTKLNQKGTCPVCGAMNV